MSNFPQSEHTIFFPLPKFPSFPSPTNSNHEDHTDFRRTTLTLLVCRLEQEYLLKRFINQAHNFSICLQFFSIFLVFSGGPRASLHLLFIFVLFRAGRRGGGAWVITVRPRNRIIFHRIGLRLGAVGAGFLPRKPFERVTSTRLRV